jgi:aspartokinase-like uncharacterized kinase
MNNIQVIKLGGSLEKSRQLGHCLNNISDCFKDPVVIVPGGGLFAKQIRQSQQYWQFNEVIAHQMAILAMQQMALLFQGLRPDFNCLQAVQCIQSALKKTAHIIWSPTINELNQAGINPSWAITSDSLAAWLATQLQASQLTLIKAADVAKIDITLLAQQGMVDHAFLRFIDNVNFKIEVISAKDFY